MEFVTAGKSMNSAERDIIIEMCRNSDSQPTHDDIWNEMIRSTFLAAYESHGVLGARFRNDMLHIALAAVAEVDVLVSWNFRLE
jgi:hypothetical protein